jgi:predicted component of type VI protein secretion system
MSFIAVYRNGELLTRRELSGPMVVGRAKASDLWIKDLRVSRQHCRIEPEGDGWVVVDLDSRNGTYFGDAAVRRHVLLEGDEVTIGDTVLRFSTAKLVPERPADPEAALAVARGEGAGNGETMAAAAALPENWNGPFPKPQARPGFPGQSGGTGEDMPTGSTMLGYGREGSGLLWEARSKVNGPPPEFKPPDQQSAPTSNA